MRGKGVRFLKLMREGEIEPAMGYRRKVEIGDEDIPVIVHQRSRDDSWSVSDEATGCAICEGAPSPGTALQIARDKIAMVGTERYFQGQSKFAQICLGGKHIKDFQAGRVPAERYQEYQIWCDETRRAPEGAVQGTEGKG